MDNKNVFNTYQKMKSKLLEYKKNNIQYVQIDSVGISPIICEESIKDSMVEDAIDIFSSFDTQKIKQLIIRVNR